MLLPSPGTASRSRNVDGAPGSAQSGLSAAERPWGHPLSSPLQAFPEIFCSNPRTKARTAEQSRWEDALQKGKMFKLGGKKELRGGMIH